MKITILALALVVALCGVIGHGRPAPGPSRAPRWHELDEAYTFEAYCRHFAKRYSEAEQAHRRDTFQKNLALILEHNKNTSHSYKMGVNQFTDMTAEEEKQSIFGLHKSLLFTEQASASRLHVNSFPRQPAASLPKEVDWRSKGVMTAVKDQGQCGSCWTFATVEAIESYWAMATGQLMVLSEQQVLDCTENPDECGGKGGCLGGTAQLAVDQIVRNGGLATEWTYPYVSHDGTGVSTNCTLQDRPPFASVLGYVSLPTNEYEPLLNHIATVGPVAISVDASKWSKYETGVFTGCDDNNIDIDHLVLLVGYGEDEEFGPYWLIRNSWQTTWGEKGYMRLRRQTTNPSCGIDSTPLDGTGCKGGPSKQYVCGSCAILFNTCFPVVAAPSSSHTALLEAYPDLTKHISTQ